MGSTTPLLVHLQIIGVAMIMKNVEEEPCEDCKKIKEIVYAKHKYGNFVLCVSCYNKRRRNDQSTYEECSICGNMTYVKSRIKTGEPVCTTCIDKYYSRKEICSKCGKLKTVTTRTKLGEPVCKTCHYKDPTTHEKCFMCGEEKTVFTRNASGKPICRKCYNNNPLNHKKCPICGKIKLLTYRIEGQLICSACHKRIKKNDVSTHEQCSICEEVKPVHKRSKLGKPICRSCYRKSKHEQCSVCKKLKPVWKKNELGKPICRRCDNRDAYKYKICSRCGKLRLVYVMTISRKPICRKCHKKDPSNYKICPVCKKLKPLINHTPTGEAICHACYAKQKRVNTFTYKKKRSENSTHPNHYFKKDDTSLLQENDEISEKGKIDVSNEQSEKRNICSICKKEIPKKTMCN